MQTSTNNTESNKDSKQETEQPKNLQTEERSTSGYSKSPEKEGEEAKQAQEEVSKKEEQVDDFGYKVNEEDKPDDNPSEEEPKKPSEEEEKVKNPATGYGQKKKEEGDKPEDKEEPKKPSEEEEKKKEEGDKPEEVEEKDLEESLKELPKGIDKEKVKNFAKENKFTKDQVNAYVDLVKSEQQEIEKSREKAIERQREQWNEDLMKDSEFGGEAFDKNVDRVEKLLENHLSETKKVLTDRGGMLPPYIMKDLLALDKVLNPKTPLVSGEPSSPKEEDDGNFLDEMYK